ncbi:MAG: hypothetical protein AB1634_09150 [Thermodesulfobacteriota bacterium]
MLERCPNCSKELKLNEAQLAKIRDALARLSPGQTLKLGCPLCHRAIVLGPDGQPVSAVEPCREPEPAPPSPAAAQAAPAQERPRPPAPPDLGWLAGQGLMDQETVEDIPRALVLAPPGPTQERCTSTLEELGYQVEAPDSSAAALERMRFARFEAVLLHTGLDGVSLADNPLHSFMAELAMDRRRHILYVLVGPAFHTLYDLEALAMSANVVVNEAHLDRLGIVLRKAIADAEALFGPYILLLKQHGKK